jgi:hypothetical protein
VGEVWKVEECFGRQLWCINAPYKKLIVSITDFVCQRSLAGLGSHYL